MGLRFERVPNMKWAITLDEKDNVAVVAEAVALGEQVDCGACSVTAGCDIPRAHKISIRAIPAGAHVIKYGQSIGTARYDIASGVLVHVDEVVSGMFYE